ncbi:hypothetical protein EB796_021408 [Bugula neritina]|uniref:Uncharacterized protein n=1 Tax=Bugula neritina TaxID=10212 RepID=A0A7J7J370_BUGNE|nr:hypothetical protein EB796_021408 [Bugula neritina]
MSSLPENKLKTHVQSNVLGFEDIISNGDGDFCTAPTHGTNSSTSTPNQKHVLKTTTIIHGADNSWRSQSEKTTLLSPSICDKCGECESCEKRKRRVYHKKQGTGESRKDASSNITSPFQPDFFQSSSAKTNKQSKWETVRAITETLIREKDMLIERQKLKRLQLEQRIRDLESKLRKITIAQVSQGHGEASTNESNQLEKEEESYRRLMSSTKLLTDTNSVAKVMFEKSQLERQLGEAEHKIAELKCLVLTQKSDMQQQLEYYKKLLNLTEEHAELNSKLTRANEELNICKEHTDRLIDERSGLEEECQRLNDELGESNEQIVQLLGQVSLLQRELSSWEQKEMLRDTTTPDDIIRLKEQQLELHSDYEDLKKVSDSKQQEFDTAVSTFENRLSELTSRLENSELLLQTAEEEAAEKDQEMNNRMETIDRLKAENEALKEKSAADREKVETAEEIVSDRTCRLEQTLIEEIVFCTSSLECLLEMYNNPRDLDISEMLSCRPTPVTISSPREYVSVLEQQNSTLKSMGEKIEKLRQFLIDKHADEMAASGHIDCSTQ